MSPQKLIFVYNAQSGKMNALLDTAHKIVSPSTYSCDLCALTFGSFRESEIWKDFREKSKVPMEFYHKNEFEKAFASKWLAKYTYPVLLIQNENGLEVGVTAQGFAELETLESLMDAVNTLIASS
tara:strand:- start:936 stop:1310 length:375 start_codon:yes stop_codon:yes gene_type:complete